MGRDPSEIEVTHNTRVLIADSDAELEKLIAQGARDSHMSLDDYRGTLDRAIVGNPEQCAEQIQKYVDYGIRYFFLIFPNPTPSENLELFAAKVMPSFADI